MTSNPTCPREQMRQVANLLDSPRTRNAVARAMLAVHDYPDADVIDDCTLEVVAAALAEVKRLIQGSLT